MLRPGSYEQMTPDRRGYALVDEARHRTRRPCHDLNRSFLTGALPWVGSLLSAVVVR